MGGRLRHPLLGRSGQGPRCDSHGADARGRARARLRDGGHAGDDGLIGERMTSPHIVRAGILAAACAVAVGVFAQTPGKRDFDAEYRAAVQSAKEAAGFDFLGTLVRTCLLPQSGGENTNDNVPDFVSNPARVPPRDSWYADPAKVFDNLYFVGGKIHSSWALSTNDGMILIDTIFPYNSEE